MFLHNVGIGYNMARHNILINEMTEGKMNCLSNEKQQFNDSRQERKCCLSQTRQEHNVSCFEFIVLEHLFYLSYIYCSYDISQESTMIENYQTAALKYKDPL